MKYHNTSDPAPANPGKEPLYKRVARDLTQSLATVALGSILPTEVELAASLGVSRSTVRDALKILEEQRMVERVRRLGTRVLRNTPDKRYIQRMDGLANILEFAGETVMRIDHVEDSDHPDEPDLAGLANPTGHWLAITGARHLADDLSISTWTRVCVPGRFAGIQPLLHGELDSIFEVIEGVYGISVSALHHSVTAIALPDYAAPVLQLAPGSAVLQVRAWLYDRHNSLVEYVRSIHNPEKFSIEFSSKESS